MLQYDMVTTVLSDSFGNSTSYNCCPTLTVYKTKLIFSNHYLGLMA